MKQKIIASSLGLIISILLLIVSDPKIPYLDANADRYFESAMSKAIVAYGTASVINASVSVIKESEIQLEPAGIGLSLAMGQVLDPVDDMVERLSDILITAIASLGTQKVIFEIGNTFIPKLLAILILILSVFVWIESDKINKFKKKLIRLTIILLAARLFLPTSALINDIIYESYFEPRITESGEKLDFYSKEIDKLERVDIPKNAGWWDTLQESAKALAKTTVQFKEAFVAVIDNLGNIIDTLLTLLWLYLGLFVIQVILLPLIMFLALVKITNSLFETSLPYMIKSKGDKMK